MLWLYAATVLWWRYVAIIALLWLAILYLALPLRARREVCMIACGRRPFEIGFKRNYVAVYDGGL